MYRSIDTEVWDDTWFADLEPDAKLLFLYLLTNRRTTACGAFEISVRMIVNETGIDAARVEELIGTFHPRVLWFKPANLIWVRNFFRRQYKNANEKQVAALRSALAMFPHIITTAFQKEYPQFFTDADDAPIPHDEPDIAYPEPTDSLSIGVSPVTVTVTRPVTEPEQEQEQEQEHLAADAAPPRPVPKPKPRNVTWDALASLCGSPQTDDEESDFGKTVKQLNAINATPEEIEAFGPWWYEYHHDARLTHRCLRRHFGAFRTAPPKPPMLTDIKSSTIRSLARMSQEDYDAATRDIPAQDRRPRGLSAPTGRLGPGERPAQRDLRSASGDAGT